MARTFPGQSPEDVSHTVDSIDAFTHHDIQLTIKDFHDAVRRLHPAQQDLSQWTFGKCVPRLGILGRCTYVLRSLKRGEYGKFKDNELAALIKDA